MAKKILKKAQKGATVKPTADSTAYYRNRMISRVPSGYEALESGDLKKYNQYVKVQEKDIDNRNRQANKGKAGYDKNGFPIPKIKSASKTTSKLGVKKTGGMVKSKKK